MVKDLKSLVFRPMKEEIKILFCFFLLFPLLFCLPLPNGLYSDGNQKWSLPSALRLPRENKYSFSCFDTACNPYWQILVCLFCLIYGKSFRSTKSQWSLLAQWQWDLRFPRLVALRQTCQLNYFRLGNPANLSRQFLQTSQDLHWEAWEPSSK